MVETADFSRRRSWTEALVWLIPLVVLVASIPLASNRPFFWMANAVLLGALGVLFAVGTRHAGTSLGVTGSGLRAPVLLFVGVAGWIALQSLAGFGAALGVGGPIATVASSVPPASVAMFVRYASYAILFALSVQAIAWSRTPDRLLHLLFAVAVLQAGLAIVSLVQLGDSILLMPKWAYLGFATGTFVNRNHLATFLAFGAAIGCTLLVADGNPAARSRTARSRRVLEDLFGRKGLLLVGLTAILVAVAATGSRMGILVTALGMAVALGLGFACAPERGVIRTLLVLGSLAGMPLLAGAMAMQSATFERLGSLEHDTDVRLSLYAQTIELVLQRPLTGHGAGSFEIAFSAVRRLPVDPDLTWAEAHNTYLELAAEIGIPATLAVLACLVGIAGTCLRALIRSQRSLPACVAALSVVTVAAAHALVDFSLQIQANVFLFVAVIGAGSGQALSRDRQTG